MALTFDSNLHRQDDLLHDTLMGFQELDSQLSLFEDNTSYDKRLPSTDPSSDTNYTSIQLDHDNKNADITTKSNFSPLIRITSAAAGLSSRSSQGVNESIRTDVAQESPSSLRSTINGSSTTSFNDPIRLMSSSLKTESDDQTSIISSISSKGTSPTDTGAISPKNSLRPTSAREVHRRKYNVRPRVSIPSDIAPQEYARQCIAAAESSRLNPYSLHAEEYAMFRLHISYAQVTTYLNLRNGILRLWNRNPLISVQRDEAIGCARDRRWFEVANVCYQWLVRNGYINYGCVEHVEQQEVKPKTRNSKKKRKTIAIIGAGMSGLGCARQLEGLIAQFEDQIRARGEELPIVMLIEGRDRIGGRVYSRGFKSKSSPNTKVGGGKRCTAEMGGMIITGFDRGNPLNIIVRGQLALSYHSLKPTTTLYDSDRGPVDPHRDQLAEKLYNDILDRVSDFKFKVAPPITVEGNKDAIDTSRDVTNEGNESIAESEQIAASIPGPSSVAVQSRRDATVVIPVASDRLTGRAHIEPGTPAVHKAAFKARLMGWELKPGVDINQDLNLTPSLMTQSKATLGSVMDTAIHQYQGILDLTPQDLRLLNWHIANLEYSNAVNFRELSLRGWDVDAGNEWEGKHTQIIGGYQQVPRGLLHCPNPLKVRKDTSVKRISYSSDKFEDGRSLIECEDGQIIDADYVVSTLPLGVLKQQSVEFDPPLPDWKMGAINRLGFGILNKVVLVYKEPFWDQKRDIFGVLRDPPDLSSLNQRDYPANRGRFFQWFNCTKTSGLPCLLALMAGDAAFDAEASTDESLLAEATQVLRGVFGPSVPRPVESIVTRWGKDRFARGSYSYTGPDFLQDDYETMASPVGNLFFAGEHTCGTHPATVHGAYISGLRAAAEVFEAVVGPIDIPTPLIPAKEAHDPLKRKTLGVASTVTTTTATENSAAAAAAMAAAAAAKSPRQRRLDAYEVEVWNAIYAQLGDRPWHPAKLSANPYIMYGKDKYEAARKKCEEVKESRKKKKMRRNNDVAAAAAALPSSPLSFSPGKSPGRRSSSATNEVRGMLARMWKSAGEEERRPYLERAEAQKRQYAAAVRTYKEGAARWDHEALAFRKVYEAEHPSVPGPEEREEEGGAKEEAMSGTAAAMAEAEPKAKDVVAAGAVEESPGRRERRAKRCAGYAEDSGSAMDLDS